MEIGSKFKPGVQYSEPWIEHKGRGGERSGRPEVLAMAPRQALKQSWRGGQKGSGRNAIRMSRRGRETLGAIPTSETAESSPSIPPRSINEANCPIQYKSTAVGGRRESWFVRGCRMICVQGSIAPLSSCPANRRENPSLAALRPSEIAPPQTLRGGG